MNKMRVIAGILLLAVAFVFPAGILIESQNIAAFEPPDPRSIILSET